MAEIKDQLQKLRESLQMESTIVPDRYEVALKESTVETDHDKITAAVQKILDEHQEENKRKTK